VVRSNVAPSDASATGNTAGGVICPCCGWSGPEFLPAGVIPRSNAQCPQCKSRERHRAMMLYLRDRTNIFGGDEVRVLHFAPETALKSEFRSHLNINYVTTALASSGASIRMDITDILFRDDTFDFVLCSHVLEHVPDDRKAMLELHRVLKPGGVALVLVPMFLDLEETLEDPNITTPKERARMFGQHDHVRRPGRDYPDRLREVGFAVQVVDLAAELGDEQSRLYALAGSGTRDLIFDCTKRLPSARQSK
jgi:SAM-dependent methyltransferase